MARTSQHPRVTTAVCPFAVVEQQQAASQQHAGRQAPNKTRACHDQPVPVPRQSTASKRRPAIATLQKTSQGSSQNVINPTGETEVSSKGRNCSNYAIPARHRLPPAGTRLGFAQGLRRAQALVAPSSGDPGMSTWLLLLLWCEWRLSMPAILGDVCDDGEGKKDDSTL
ncbi:hypothetical protein M409DRAFT_59063 [Zasmidium cellare ATCC 36951]|uniref:Uncharacterized protein n=1 Tax=Zasmidium cellare ATCC 36951 TaxID=1080233 RepID=A0A6A6C3T5_ZASCE|nr:uncharacterized protein M409DRAFT_59063 [Zasmidium cellare ATCC 36951]KAF2161685.1 hypothetical protein M409DRAFT_59063 [Zasmidium cellare ATCC 36951]